MLDAEPKKKEKNKTTIIIPDEEIQNSSWETTQTNRDAYTSLTLDVLTKERFFNGSFIIYYAVTYTLILSLT